jgi:hypothetical protein
MLIDRCSALFAFAGEAAVAAARALALRSLLPLRASQLLAVFGVSERLKLLQREGVSDAGALPGHWVLLRDERSRQSQWLQLVWPAEAAPAKGRISVLSPLGLALLGKEPASAVRLQVLGVRFEFQLLEMLAVRRKSRARREK